MRSLSHGQQWLITVITVLCGAVCGVHIAKLGPSMTAIINEYSMSLTEAGVLASTFTLLTIFVGALVGNLMPQIGVKRLICSAMMLSTIGGIVALASSDYEALIIGRALEGIGLIIMMIAGPTAVSMFTALGSRAKHMGLWAAFMPLGTGLSFLLAPYIIPTDGWRGLWLFSIIFSVTSLFGALIVIPKDRQPVSFSIDKQKLRKTLAQAPLLWLGIVFAMHSLVFHVILQFIPVYGTQSLHASFTTISLVIGAFCILNVFGNLIAGNAIHRGVSPSRLIQLQFVIAPILGLIVFTSNFPDIVKLGTILFGAFFTSMVPTSCFTLIAKLADEPTDIPAYNGLMLQVQGAGILFGPSLTGWAVEFFNSWSVAGIIFSGGSAAILLIVYVKLRGVDSYS
ncbi:MFS transporter [Litoricolaceae bacterium]|nr:MFS transporter [Litorivicinaceae bacterium]